ncbi:hypothetical protein [Lactobacillus xujianguonis]|nr:hypothetical protein [Lactobacillus xujianguonis]
MGYFERNEQGNIAMKFDVDYKIDNGKNLQKMHTRINTSDFPTEEELRHSFNGLAFKVVEQQKKFKRKCFAQNFVQLNPKIGNVIAIAQADSCDDCAILITGKRWENITCWVGVDLSDGHFYDGAFNLEDLANQIYDTRKGLKPMMQKYISVYAYTSSNY